MHRTLGIAVALATVAASTLSFSQQAASVAGAPHRLPSPPVLTAQSSGTANRLQAVSPVSASVVWASGLGGTFTVTTDGGNTWRAGVVPGAEALQFRDVQGVSDQVAYLMSSGTGSDSRIYKTVDGGANWTCNSRIR